MASCSFLENPTFLHHQQATLLNKIKHKTKSRPSSILSHPNSNSSTNSPLRITPLFDQPSHPTSSSFIHFLTMLPFLPLFLPLLIFLSSPASSRPQQGDELFFPGFKASAANLTLDGAAGIRNNGLLRLTNDTSRLSGHAFYSSPVRFKNSSDGKVFSFSTAFVLAIVPEYPKLGGHGMAFTIATSPVLNALPSQYLGLLNATDVGNFTNHLLAVEFDTVQDFEFQDINDNHVGIDINSLVSNASAPVGFFADGSTKRNLTLKSGQPIQAWVDYDSALNLLAVSISPDSSKPKRPLISFPVDLSPIFDEFMCVGFSASTGLLASAHYIQGWSFKVNGEAQSLDLPSLPSLPGPKKKHTGLTIGVSVSSVILGLSVLALAICLVYKIKNADPIEDWEMEIGPHRFSYDELKQATSNFSEKMVLGHGGFGKVYGGTLPSSKTQIAVKRISHESKQGLQEFVSEITTIGHLRHRNLAQLVGWCRRRGDLLLVYEFMANGSLDRFIFGEARSALNWEQRFKIIKDVAAGLLYLHEGYEQVVIHRDVKASNVLVDNGMNGKLGDFGLAKLYEHGSTPGTTRVVGTLGYLAPELPRTGKATASSDVYAFGALMLEVACGRRPIEPKARGEELVLVDWVWEMFKEGKILEVVDPRLMNGDYIESEMLVVLKLGLMCSNYAPSARPSMRQVLRCLDGEAEAGVPDNLRTRDDSGAEKGLGEGFDEFLNALVSASFNDLSSYSFSRNGNGNGNGSSYGGTSFASLSTSPFSAQHGRDTRFSV